MKPRSIKQVWIDSDLYLVDACDQRGGKKQCRSVTSG